MDENHVSKGSSGGVTFVGLLQITFIVLKLCNVIDWSWLWVLSPMWISFTLTIILIIIVMIFMRRR